MNIFLKLRLMSCNSLFHPAKVIECVLITFSLLFDKLLTFLNLLFQLWPAGGAGGRKQQTSGWDVWASASARSPQQPGWEGQSGTATESPGQRSSSVWQLTECKTSFEACWMAFFYGEKIPKKPPENTFLFTQDDKTIINLMSEIQQTREILNKLKTESNVRHETHAYLA